MPYLICDYCGYLESDERDDCVNCGKPYMEATSQRFDSLGAAADYSDAVKKFHEPSA